MRIYKKFALSLITLAFTWTQVAFATGETHSQKNTAYSLVDKTLFSDQLIEYQASGLKINDKNGNNLTVEKILSGKYKKFIYHPEPFMVPFAEDIYFEYTTDTSGNTFTLTALNSKEQTMAAKVFNVDLTEEEHLRAILPILNEFNTEMKQAMAKKGNKSDLLSTESSSSVLLFPYALGLILMALNAEEEL